MSTALFELQEVAYGYDSGLLVSGLSVQIKSGTKVAISGNSGSGKSSLLKVLASFLPLSKGTFYYNEKPLSPALSRQVRKEIAWVPQEMIYPFDTAMELFRWPHSFAANRSREIPDPTPLMEKFNLCQTLLKQPLEMLSGGEKQRILMLSGLLLGKNIFLLDEPTAALDQTNKEIIIDYLLKNPAYTVIAATHDTHWIAQCDLEINLEKYRP